MFRALLAAAILFAAPCAAYAIALDGTPTALASHGTAACASTTITTTGTNEILVVFASADNTNATGSAPAVTSYSASTVTWHTITPLAGVNYHSGITGTPFITTAIAWALAPTATTYGVTVNFSGTIDNCSVIVAAVSGANTSSPLDPNASLPHNNGGINTAGAPSVSGVSTSCNKTLIAQTAAYWNNSATQADQTAGTGFTTVSNNPAQAGSLFGKHSVQYGAFASAQTGQTFSFGTSWPGNLSVVVALQDATATCAGTLGLPAGSLMTLGVGE